MSKLMKNSLKIVRMNNKKIKTFGRKEVTYKPSIYVASIVESDGNYAQIKGVKMNYSEIEKYIDVDVKEVFEGLVFHGGCKQVDGVHGVNQCGKFWNEKGKSPFLLRTKLGAKDELYILYIFARKG